MTPKYNKFELGFGKQFQGFGTRQFYNIMQKETFQQATMCYIGNTIHCLNTIHDSSSFTHWNLGNHYTSACLEP